MNVFFWRHDPQTEEQWLSSFKRELTVPARDGAREGGSNTSYSRIIQIFNFMMPSFSIKVDVLYFEKQNKNKHVLFPEHFIWRIFFFKKEKKNSNYVFIESD